MTLSYQLVAELSAQFPVARLCQVLNLSRSGYYAYQAGDSHSPAQGKQQLQIALRDSFAEHRRRYGSRRLLAELREQGYQVGRHQLRQLMRNLGLHAIQPRSFVPRPTDSRHHGPFSPNLLLGTGRPTMPGQVLVGDITYVPLAGGTWAYLAAWMDLFSRKIKGWSLAENMETELVNSALRKAIGSNQLMPGSIIHSDRGGQYVGKAFGQTLTEYQFVQRMSRPDDPYDNAFMESCWSRLKAELRENGVFGSLEDARIELFEYIECYYNRKRRHSSLGNLSPDQFEQNYYQNLTQNLHP